MYSLMWRYCTNKSPVCDRSISCVVIELLPQLAYLIHNQTKEEDQDPGEHQEKSTRDEFWMNWLVNHSCDNFIYNTHK